MNYSSRILLLLLFIMLGASLSAQKLDMEKLSGMKPRSIGPAGMSGRITAIDVVANDRDIIYAGSASGGLWKTTSGGINWEPIFDKESVMSIGAVAVQQDNPSIVWVGTGEGNPRNSLNGGYGIYKSLDAGKTWKLMGLEKTRNIHRIVIDPKNPNTIYVGAIGSPWGEHPERGVFKTTDGGQTWEKILYVDEKTGCAELVMDPSNPNKLIAAMWQHRRWPWFFKSGGPGSGLHVTMDGGKTWTKRTEKDGLPAGDLGRIGLAIARSKPEVVYALVEAKKNALYRSADGGYTWQMVNDKMNEIGNRPFYYHEIYADTKNENRLYTIYSEVNVSEDGGRSFQKLLPYSGVHPDHHAWWIHPEDPSFMIDGNDGGLNITHDYGKNWRFIENLPVGQFYHINVDMDYPYNIYGGMQDNGSWVGPAYVWKNDGIRNSYWQEVLFGDGFDAVADPDDNRYGYAMSQQGNLARFDRKTGYSKMIKPTYPNTTVQLRYNWNSGLALDPLDNNTLYYGSQFLHRSTDKGNTWEIISGDLTTNDPEKQKALESGGLTIDATGAENHCSILTIAPSKKERGVIWVGTDDGQLQLTRDGGKTWVNLTSKMVGMPKNAWIPQVVTSSYNAGEVFVVVNNYRQFDFKPYVFRSKDYGQTWESLVNAAQVGDNNYTLAIVQDPIEPKLLFLGTENGLFVSLDEGKNYTKWTSGYPAGLSTMDLVIHPREHDLAIGTFGRAIYVLDDIRPLREMAKEGVQILNKKVHLFDAPDAYIVETQTPSGIRFPGNAMFAGEDRTDGGLISYVINRPEEKKEEVKPEPSKADPKKGDKGKEVKPVEKKEEVKKEEKKVKYDSLTLEIFNGQGEKIRTLKQKTPETNGLHRMNWSLTEKGVRGPSREKARPGASEPEGIFVLPGTYKLKMTFGDQKDSASITVKNDPRFGNVDSNLAARYSLQKQLQKMTELAATGMDRLRESKEIVEEYEKKMKDQSGEQWKEAKEKTKAMKDSINTIMDYIVGKASTGQGLARSGTPTPVSYIGVANMYISSSKDPVSATDQRVFKQAEDQMKQVASRVNNFFDKSWADYRAVMEKVSISPFKNYSPLKN